MEPDAEEPPLLPPLIVPERPHTAGARLRNYFLTGIIVAGPLAVTAYIVWYIITTVDGWVKPWVPSAYVPDTYLPFRVPGYGSVDWKGFFSVLAEAGYTGAMNIENEDNFYYPSLDSQGNFTEQYKRGFRVAHEFLKTLVPPLTA